MADNPNKTQLTHVRSTYRVATAPAGTPLEPTAPDCSISAPKMWRYAVQHGPDGEADYAWVYDGDNNLVCTTKTHYAIAIVTALSGKPGKQS